MRARVGRRARRRRAGRAGRGRHRADLRAAHRALAVGGRLLHARAVRARVGRGLHRVAARLTARLVAAAVALTADRQEHHRAENRNQYPAHAKPPNHSGYQPLLLLPRRHRVPVRDSVLNGNRGRANARSQNLTHARARPAARFDRGGESRCCIAGEKAEVGFEPTNNGFAIRPLSPLGYSAAACGRYTPSGLASSQAKNSPRFPSDLHGTAAPHSDPAARSRLALGVPVPRLFCSHQASHFLCVCSAESASSVAHCSGVRPRFWPVRRCSARAAWKRTSPSRSPSRLMRSGMAGGGARSARRRAAVGAWRGRPATRGTARGRRAGRPPLALCTDQLLGRPGRRRRPGGTRGGGGFQVDPRRSSFTAPSTPDRRGPSTPAGRPATASPIARRPAEYVPRAGR